MSLLNILLCFICAAGVASGQLLIKGASIAWNQAGSLFNPSVAVWIGGALLVYSTASMGWLYILKNIPLSAAYPFLGITFLLVPLASYFVFHESLSWRDCLAALFIILGICLVSFGRSSS